ncbi:phage major capsid protein [Terrisporobacter hibernicus]|uniref:Phage major capsid protein n=1 Tax=Terrisporobacter hibernicus TaxID=2813371 RepID=A0AAX2ZG77_9FIRM|nr:phage major capsid protein [Terrisporobacter hibernicus]UEL48313.1 phage major capsid protein [Terrisporobacter hibernicus]
MKKLIEKRAKIMAKLDEHLEQDGEVRALDKEKLEEVDAMINEVKEIDAQLEQSKEIRTLKNTKEMKVEDMKDMEKRELLLNGTEVEVRDMTKSNVAGETVTNGALVVDRAKELGLKDYARIEKFNGNSIIPVQRNKMGKLVKASELAEISKKDVLVEQVDLRPEKYALLTVVSEELINDASYNIESLIKEEGNQAIDETVEGMLADTLNKATGIIEISPITEGVITLDDINNLYFGLNAKYRKNAIFVVNDAHLKALVGLKDNDGQPILQRDLTQEFGYKLMGRPVIFCEDVTNMMFVDMEKAVVAGIGTNAQVKRSDDAYFTTAGVAFRTTIALDAKTCIEQAIAKIA